LGEKNCFNGAKDVTTYTQETCEKCYSIFFGLKGNFGQNKYCQKSQFYYLDSVGDQKFETYVAERGCVYKLEDGSDFPAADCASSPCEITLTENNYGLNGQILANYATELKDFDEISDMKYSSLQTLKCAQCDSANDANVSKHNSRKIFFSKALYQKSEYKSVCAQKTDFFQNIILL